MALADWFRSNEGRAVAALERLVQLYELDLASRGVFTSTAEEVGEVLETSQALLSRLEAENDYRRAYGLGAEAPIGALNPLTGEPWGGGTDIASAEEAGTTEKDAYLASLFSSGRASGGWSFGPEGAEEAQPGVAEGWSAELPTPGPPSRFSYRSEQKGESRPDSGEEPQRGGELGGGPVGTEAGEPAQRG